MTQGILCSEIPLIERVDKEPPLGIDSSTLFEGDALTVLRRLKDQSARCVITSPPYWGLRSYGIDGQIGLETSITQYLNKLVTIFSEIKRILTDDGTLWLNIGDGYTSGNRGYRAPDRKNPARAMSIRPDTPEGLKPKDLIGVPWRLAFALQEDGWYLRNDIVWHKPNAMPESVKDRPARSHEYIFMLTKSEQYYYDWQASREPAERGGLRNRRSVWAVNTRPFTGAHFATFPTELIRPCILASTKPHDFVLDPFFGSGTVGVASNEAGRQYIGIELNPEYVALAARRLQQNSRTKVRIVAA